MKKILLIKLEFKMPASKIINLQNKINRWFHETSRFYNIKPNQVTELMVLKYLALNYDV